MGAGFIQPPNKGATVQSQISSKEEKGGGLKAGFKEKDSDERLHP
jgi:cold shock CspA family protein